MCIHTLYLFTHCHHHTFSKHARHHCPTATAHFRSLADPTHPEAPRCSLRKAHPFTARLVHAPCARCQRQLDHESATKASSAFRPAASALPAQPNADGETDTDTDSTNAPSAPESNPTGASHRIDPELAREAHPAILPLTRPPTWRAPLYALPSDLNASGRDSLPVPSLTHSHGQSQSQSHSSAASISSVSSAPSSVRSGTAALANVLARVGDVAGGLRKRRDERHRPLLLVEDVYAT